MLLREGFELRWLRPATAPEVVREVASWLEDVRPRTTWPQVFEPEGEAELCCLFEGERLVSHAALRRVDLIGPLGGMHAGLVGSVVTAPADRGRGLAGHLLEELAAAAVQGGLDALLLWAGRRELYERLGYRPAGRQWEAVLRARPACARIRPARAGDLMALWEMHRRKPQRVERSLGQQALLMTVPDMQVVVLERQGVAAAYACLGKGMDFRGWWHELGGSDEDLAELLPGALALAGQATATVLIPPYRTSLLERLRPSCLQVMAGAGALRKTLTPAGAGDFFVDGLDSI